MRYANNENIHHKNAYRVHSTIKIDNLYTLSIVCVSFGEQQTHLDSSTVLLFNNIN